MSLRLKILAALIALSYALSAHAYVLDRQESDSVAAALGTIWGDFIKSKPLAQATPEQTAEFTRGLTQAIALTDSAPDYLRGLSQGIVLADRLAQVEKLGGFKVPLDRFAYYLLRAIDGHRTGFSRTTADDYLTRIAAIAQAEDLRLRRDAQYMAEQEARPEVTSTPSGLLFETITPGQGPSPAPTDMILVDYTGAFTSGQVFNRSTEGSPTPFVVRDLIPGFAEGVKMMQKGGTYRLSLPPEIAYGRSGSPGVIPPDAVTVFTVHLIDFKPAE